MSSSLDSFVIRSLNASSGAAANATGPALSTEMRRSGIRTLVMSPASFLQPAKKLAKLAPNFRAARKPPPMRADQTHQLVAFIDGREVILRRARPARRANTVCQQGYDVRFHFAQHRICLRDVIPCVEWQQRFDRPRRTRIKSNHFSVRAAVKKESHLDGNHQTFPLAVRHLKILKKQHRTRNTFVFCAALAIKQNCASTASANQFVRGWFNHVLMLGKQLTAAHLAAFHRRPLARDLPQLRKRVLGLPFQSGRHLNPRSVERVAQIAPPWPGLCNSASETNVEPASEAALPSSTTMDDASGAAS